MFLDPRTLFALAIVFFAVLVGAWMFRYEGPFGSPALHRNRITGVVCPVDQECWFINRR